LGDVDLNGYLGTIDVESLDGTEFEGYGPAEWGLYFIMMYGGIDGDHHKTWVLDQVARCLLGTPVKVKLARWENGQQEYRCSTQKPPSDKYLKWVEDICEGGEYSYDEGIAP